MTGTTRAAARAAADEQHMTLARRHAPVLVARVRQLVRGGVDLTNPERFTDLVTDQVTDAIKDTAMPGCPLAKEVAAAALIAELARLLAEATR